MQDEIISLNVNTNANRRIDHKYHDSNLVTQQYFHSNPRKTGIVGRA